MTNKSIKPLYDIVKSTAINNGAEITLQGYLPARVKTEGKRNRLTIRATDGNGNVYYCKMEGRPDNE